MKTYQKIKLTHLDKILYPEKKVTKGEVIAYHKQFSDLMLPHVRDRLLVMNRFPNGIHGEHFFEKNAPQETPDWIKTRPVKSEDGKVTNYIVCDDKETLVWVANLASLELNSWLSKIDELKKPDLLVFDMDPYKVGFEKVLEVAHIIYKLLENLNLKCFTKTSGKRGVHIMLPIASIYTFDQTKDFVLKISQELKSKYPKLITLEHNKAKRNGVYIDYLQNVYAKTMVAPYSLRPTKDATISAPIDYDEVREGTIRPEEFNIKTIAKRIAKKGDLFKDIYKYKQKLPL